LDIKKINRKSAVHFIEDDKCFYIKVKKISKELSPNKQVYDIQVENSHSFLANGILAHNTILESMAAGTPVIVPDNTVMPEIVGNGRGYVYPCKEKTYIDNSGFRKIGHLDDIVDTMYKAYVDWKDPTINRNSIIVSAKSFAITHSWKDICKSWVALFATTRYVPTTSSFRGEKV
jgi:glycosyltransferase involved in cell wall biosynthesis